LRSQEWTGDRVHRMRTEAPAWIERLWPLVRRFMPLLLAAFTFVVYLLTMAPRLTWEHAGRDGGDFITAAWFLGVPHPTGYPTYTILAWLFSRIPFGGVAWRVHLLSAFAGAGTVALVYVLGRRMAGDRNSTAAVLGAAVGALLLAFSPLFWGHSLIAEVYALLLFFMALVLWLMLRWRDGEWPLWLAALAFGLGMGNHITLLFIVPLVLLLLWSGRQRLSWKDVVVAAVALGGGLLVYAYLPWRASTDPIINWGGADTAEGFRWMVTGQGYRRFFFALPSEELLSRLGDWGNLTRSQFPVLAWALAVLGLWDLGRRDRWLAVGTLLSAAISLVYSIGYNTTDAFVLLLPVYFYGALWMGQGAVYLFAAVERMRGPRERRKFYTGLVTAGLFLLPLFSLVEEYGGMDVTHDRKAETYALEAFGAVEPGSLILVGSDSHTFALWYYHYVEGVGPDVAPINYAMLNFDWYQDTVKVHHPEIELPDVNASPVKRATVLANLGKRPVYIAEDEQDLEGLEVTAVGNVWRVTAP
jgi:4-amino-4-deoxy-L-arabinose transferase-like glycosyltransferase